MGQLTAMQMANKAKRQIRTIESDCSEEPLYQVMEDGEVLDSFLSPAAAEVFRENHGIPEALLLRSITRRHARTWDHLQAEVSRSDATEYLFAYLGIVVEEGDLPGDEKFWVVDELEDRFIEMLSALPT